MKEISEFEKNILAMIYIPNIHSMNILLISERTKESLFVMKKK